MDKVCSLPQVFVIHGYSNNVVSCDMQVELVPGYGVYVSKMKLDTAVDSSQGQPTRLVRKLLSAFFSAEILAKSSARGSRTYAALDHNIVAAIISKLGIILCIMVCIKYL